MHLCLDWEFSDEIRWTSLPMSTCWLLKKASNSGVFEFCAVRLAILNLCVWELIFKQKKNIWIFLLKIKAMESFYPNDENARVPHAIIWIWFPLLVMQTPQGIGDGSSHWIPVAHEGEQTQPWSEDSSVSNQKMGTLLLPPTLALTLSLSLPLPLK